MIKEWLSKNKPTVCNEDPLNRDTISIDFRGNIKRTATKRKAKLCMKKRY